MKTNSEAFNKAKSLIEHHQYVLDSEWSDAQPTTEEENKFLEKHGWSEYGQWFLGLHTDQSEETKSRYGFPYGDFRRVHHSGLIAAKQRAAQNHYQELENDIDALLQMFEQEKAH
uniref:Uncharacterized protein n=1 Tax=Roseihalotalea indica TaxID=2867963 RepID=A0AA49GSG4_9BACT|nr:hypothetical protein K4G66_02405 [Tunicatimonas sp. TK19036]